MQKLFLIILCSSMFSCFSQRQAINIDAPERYWTYLSTNANVGDTIVSATEPFENFVVCEPDAYLVVYEYRDTLHYGALFFKDFGEYNYHIDDHIDIRVDVNSGLQCPYTQLKGTIMVPSTILYIGNLNLQLWGLEYQYQQTSNFFK